MCMQIQKDSLIGLTLFSAVCGAVFGVLIYVAVAEYSDFQLPGLSRTIQQTTETSSVPPLEARVVSAVQKVQPSVVSILITKDVPTYVTAPGFDPFFNQFLPSPFFGNPGQSPGTEKRQVGGGSGFIVGSEGLIVTNEHVVSDATAEYTVITNDGKRYPAKVLARDPILDLAYIKIEGQNFQTLSFGDSDKIKLGQTVLAVGNALDEFRNTVTMGIVSGLNRTLVAENALGRPEVIEGAIQTDAAINPGSSGGPLVDLDGNVIGINTAMAVDSQLIGFALPANLVKTGAEQVQKTGKITHAFLGVRYQTLTVDLIEKNKFNVSHGALIVRGSGQNEPAILPGSPAEKAGLRENDIILQFDGIEVSDSNSLSILITGHAPGDIVPIKINREGNEMDLTVTLGELNR